jgi:ribulose-5-phosphate 4-epimerase/fuculose-1-phosphate aldolase
MMSETERQLRIDLAAVYRLIALQGWDDMIFTHVSARIPGPEHHFLLNPFGMYFDEISASSLVKVDMQGHAVEPTSFPVNPAGFTVHSAVHMARPDVQCVIHLHTDHGVAVAAQKKGLLPLSQHAMMVLGSLAYHDYEGVAFDLEERERLARDLGGNACMILRNHGTLAVGQSCGAAWLNAYFLERACTMQALAQSGGTELEMPNQGVPEKVFSQSASLFDGTAGAFAWPHALRRLDRIDPSYRN